MTSVPISLANEKIRPRLKFNVQGQLKGNPYILAGSVIVGFMILVGLLAPIISPKDPNLPNTDQLYELPGSVHLFGTDEIGRDILSRMIYGTRVSLIVGLSVTLVSGTTGVLLGAISGYYGGWVDIVIMRLSDTFLSTPGLVLALGAVAILGPGLLQIIVAISLTGWAIYARIVRSTFLMLKEKQYIEAAIASGACPSRIIFRHILPNAFNPILVMLALNVAGAILAEASLGYLGIGVSAPTATWGSMLVQGLKLIRVAPHVAIFPGIAILLTALGFNMLGEGLQEVMDPKMKRQTW